MYRQEIRQPLHYTIALGVGTVLTILGRMDIAAAVVPFVVPFLVSSISRTAARTRQRHTELLLQLPSQRRSPAFVMCVSGRIEASLGNTRELFVRHGITRLEEFVDSPDTRPVTDHIIQAVETGVPRQLYSPVSGCWYRVSVFAAREEHHLLVWMDDISEELQVREQRAVLRTYQIEVMQEFSRGYGSQQAADGNPVSRLQDERLARLILDADYAAVMFAEEKTPGSVEAVIYTPVPGEAGDIRRSQPIAIGAESGAPIFRSREAGHAVIADHGFEDEYRVVPEVKAFIGEPIYNLVNYHAARVSIMAFNKASGIAPADTGFIEAAVDAAHSLYTAIHAAEDRDLRFIQSIHGLCASAEFSDEITGSHIWRVNEYSALIARELCVDGVLCREIGQVAAVHDIGKVAVPELVQAPRVLTPEEWEQMQMHTIYGARILDRMIQLSDNPDPRLTLARDIALHHHQRWDGQGYPRIMGAQGLAPITSRDPGDYRQLRPLQGDEIPLAARIVSIADTYDALRSERPYKAGFEHAAALRLIARDDRSGAAGADRFGPDVYAAFLNNVDEIAAIFDRLQ